MCLDALRLGLPHATRRHGIPGGLAILLIVSLAIVAHADQRIIVLGDDDDNAPRDSASIEISIGDRSGRMLIDVESSSGKVRIETDSSRVGEDDYRKPRRDFDWDDEDFVGACVEADDIVRFGQDIFIPEGKMVPGSVVCILGSIRVAGVVNGEVVAIGGHIDIEQSGTVHGEAVAVGGGDIRLDTGAVIHGEAVTVGGRIRQDRGSLIGERVEISFMPSIGPNVGFTGIGWIGFIAHFLFVGLAGWAIVRLAMRRVGISVATLRVRGWESLLAGLGGGILYSIVIGPLVAILIVALAAIVIGIPLIPVLALLLLIFPVPGYVITCALLGLSIIGRSAASQPVSVEHSVPDPTLVTDRRVPGAAPSSGFPSRGLLKAFFLGHLLLSSAGFLSVTLASVGMAGFGMGSTAKLFLLLGLIVGNVAILLGWGAVLLSRMGSRHPLYRTG